MALVHRAFGAVSAARQARLWAGLPPCADRSVPGHQAERERESRETMDEPWHSSRMLDRRDAVKLAAAKEPSLTSRRGFGFLDTEAAEIAQLDRDDGDFTGAAGRRARVKPAQPGPHQRIAARAARDPSRDARRA